jgi:hypothetical protein
MSGDVGLIPSQSILSKVLVSTQNMVKFVHDYKATPHFSNYEFVYKTVLYLGNHGTSCTIIHLPTWFWF